MVIIVMLSWHLTGQNALTVMGTGHRNGEICFLVDIDRGRMSLFGGRIKV
jgi:hypothetical protein